MVRLSERGGLAVAQVFGRHQGVEELIHDDEPSVVGATLIENAVVEALLRAGLEVHGALSLLSPGVVTRHLREALDCLDEAINEVRRDVAKRVND